MSIQQPTFTREHRLGLVVYGGVSLAIYMNGICREFYDAVRGRGIYKLIKALTDADIVVDIISGTSAGGVNGVLLSYALANSDEQKCIPFEEFAKIWIESGDIKKLLFDSKYDGVYKNSFLDGADYYKSQLQKALSDRQRKRTCGNDWISHSQNLDLFVTGTDLLGRIYETFDNTGRIIEVKDHRTIFHLKWHESGENTFQHQDQTTHEALAKLCQITSCFPGAFPPVTVHIDTEDEKANLVDKKLVEWGQLRKNRRLPKKRPLPVKNMLRNNQSEIEDDFGEGYRLHFVDGGVLDNRPFTHAIETIYQRTTERRVFRKLFYVDPSPDRFLDNTRYKRMMKPGPLQVIADSLSALPRYESINNDLELIKQHNEKVRRYKFLLAEIEVLLDQEVKDLQNEDLRDQQVFVYQRARLLKLKDKLVSRVYLESEDCLQDLQDNNEIDNQELNDQSELTQKIQTLIEELTARLDVDPELSDSLDAARQQVGDLLKQDQKQSARRDLDKAIELLTKPLEPDENEHWVTRLKDVYDETDGLDIEYALRQHFFIVDYIHELLDVDTLRKWFFQKLKLYSQPAKPRNQLSKTDILATEFALDALSNANFADTKAVELLREQLRQQSEDELEESKENHKILIENLLKISQKQLPEISQDLISPLQVLIKDLNQCVKFVQEVNREVDLFFSKKSVSRYFKELAKSTKDLSRDFPSRFYVVMCFLHKKLLYIEEPNYSPELALELTNDLNQDLQETRARIFCKLEEQGDCNPSKNVSILNKIPALEGLSLQDLKYKTYEHILDKSTRDSNESQDKSINFNEISILQIISFAAEQCIEYRLSLRKESIVVGEVQKSSGLKNARYFLQQRLKSYFSDFKKLDEFLFPLDYLAGLSEKQLIETYRISPEDARYGLSAAIKRGKRLEQKLAGDSLNAFGGFLKQSWRENDILWGRLDGLNRIVESLVTDDQVKKFPDFLEQQAKKLCTKGESLDEAKEKYLDYLLDEAFASDNERLEQQLKQEVKEKIKALLKALNEASVCDNNSEQKAHEVTKYRSILVQALVRAGHLLILEEERGEIHELGAALDKVPSSQNYVDREDKKMEAAFREHYKVGLETLREVPKADWEEIKTRGTTIAKDIIKTYRHKRYTRLAPKWITSLLGTRNRSLRKVKLFVLFLFYLLLIPLLLYFIVGGLLLLLILVLCLLPLAISYIDATISRKPRRFKRAKFTFFRYRIVLENLFFKTLTSIATCIFRVSLSLSPGWKNLTNPMRKRRRNGSKRDPLS